QNPSSSCECENRMPTDKRQGMAKRRLESGFQRLSVDNLPKRLLPNERERLLYQFILARV
ncbi:MAG: hypothetical protein WAK48_12620, partial [Candidatus Acidiferrum sp.]